MSQCRITIEYDGSAYNGWQVQKNGPSVQEKLENALERLTGSRQRIRGAGRTDAGVHARGQTAAFPMPHGIPPDKIPQAMNSRLPDDIAVISAKEVDDSFDPRHNCILKQYSYSYTLGHLRPALGSLRSWHIKWPLNLDRMQRATAYFLGEHDFTSFANQERSGEDNTRSVERSELRILPVDAAGRVRLVYTIEGRSFLYNMVRCIAGTLVEIGLGRFEPSDIPAILAQKKRAAAGQSAPAWGLCLEWTLYPGEDKPADRQGLF